MLRATGAGHDYYGHTDPRSKVTGVTQWTNTKPQTKKASFHADRAAGKASIKAQHRALIGPKKPKPSK
jgi:hypothetical protein